MKVFVYANKVTGETKQPIEAATFALADEFFECTYWYTGSNWHTVEKSELLQTEITKRGTERKYLPTLINSQAYKAAICV